MKGILTVQSLLSVVCGAEHIATEKFEKPFILYYANVMNNWANIMSDRYLVFPPHMTGTLQVPVFLRPSCQILACRAKPVNSHVSHLSVRHVLQK